MSRPVAGCRLSVKASAAQSFEAKRDLSRLRIDADSIVYATFVDNSGLSVYVKRGVHLPDLQAFVPNGSFTNWQTYFDLGTAFGDSANFAYASSRHAKARFPDDCV